MPDQEKLHQVAMLTAAGKSQRQIASQVGIPPATVHRYQHRSDAEQLINELRPAIAARLSERMWDMVDAETFNVPPQQLAIIWGIAMDKEQRAQQLEHPTIDNRQLVIVIPGLTQEPQTGLSAVTIDVPKE